MEENNMTIEQIINKGKSRNLELNELSNKELTMLLREAEKQKSEELLTWLPSGLFTVNDLVQAVEWIRLEREVYPLKPA